MSAYLLVSLMALCIALGFLITGVKRQQKNLLTRAGVYAVVAVVLLILGLVMN
ncbi:hypothetical protein PANPA_00033 (plasmid) [Pantoea sp. Nvir]|uniref:hypothetical protein n=1 Tax=Pantoea TaxID=53335 RepID=UPI001304BA90|nr:MULTISPECIES: hypothetical protein [Pantoea]MCG7368092.1 hypothetical protein [Pantoea sp. ACRSH]MCG7398451.1 hypothetical protein [Pantoea sp. ACRSC]UBN52424.1 hypothetical protein LB453_02375 [Pantoea agglomerans]